MDKFAEVFYPDLRNGWKYLVLFFAVISVIFLGATYAQAADAEHWKPEFTKQGTVLFASKSSDNQFWVECHDDHGCRFFILPETTCSPTTTYKMVFSAEGHMPRLADLRCLKHLTKGLGLGTPTTQLTMAVMSPLGRDQDVMISVIGSDGTATSFDVKSGGIKDIFSKYAPILVGQGGKPV